MRRQREFTAGRVSRRQFVQGVGASSLLALGLVGTSQPGSVQAATPRAGGVARIRGRDPLGWDPMLTVSPRTHIAVSFTHNRLFRHKSGPDVAIGTMIVEPDLVERWEEPSDTRYVFHLRQGVRWHDKPPVGGRELVAEDVRYTLERFLNLKGNSNRSLLADITAVKVLSKYTIQVDIAAPNVWFLDYVAEASTLPIIAKEAVEKFKTLKQPEAVIGTGPWMLASYAPGTQGVFRKHPAYFRAGLPYLNEVHLLIIDDDVTATAAYMAGQLDFGPALHHSIRGSEIREFRDKHPDWYYKGFRPNLHAYLAMRTDQSPFQDQRVRQAISMAINREVIQSQWRRSDTAVPASFPDWHLPVDQAGEGARYYAYNPEESRRLLQEAGYPKGFQTSVLVHSAASSQWADYVERVVSWLRDIGITVQIVDKEYGAFIRLLMQRKYDGMVLSPNRPFVIPDGFIYWRYRPGDPRNVSYVDDPKMFALAQAQRREKDVKKRKAIFDEISRLAAVNQYYIHFNSWPRIATWRPYVQNFHTNLGYDYGGPLESAWFATF